ncbi:MAG: CehA/McbA family metallohydrolase [Sphaerochaetaceae bacterium]|jgi:hypothetical protein|nr:CehA/McbA family metallohydrolase [Sphaerochaetaceae bacterium]
MRKSAFPSKEHWYKGNIHSHTTLSDGAIAPMDQIRLYKDAGYDFLAFTDHNVMNDDPSWSKEGPLMLKAWERDILYSYKVKCTHIVGLFSPDCQLSTFRREPGDKRTMTDQDLVDQMKKENVFLSLAHPTWSRMEPEEILNLNGFDAVEVFNTGTERLCHEGHAEWVWDMLLRHGRHVLGIACDDTHSHTEKDDHFGGWTYVNCNDLSWASIIDALKKGDYYSTMGPIIKDWGLDDGKVYIECSPCSEIHFITYPARGKACYGENLTSMEYALKGGEAYVRVEVIDSSGKKAWTNPIYF